ncbi:hypothetical protein ACB092_06G077600 [Castanea dentata]
MQLVSNSKSGRNMSSTSRDWKVAASLGAVEAMKNQGICRQSNTLRSLQQHPKISVRSYSQAKRLSAPSSSVISKM